MEYSIMTRNKTHRIAWMWETTPGTTLLDAADDVTYFHGRNTSELQSTSFSAFDYDLQSSYKYDTRNPEITDGLAKPTEQSVTYNPINSVPYRKFMGNATDASPDTCTYLDTGTKTAYSLRTEQSGGTADHFIQYNGCFTIGLTGDISLARPYQITERFIWMNLDDQGDHPTLTTSPTYPEAATAGATNVYDNSFDFSRDAGGTPAQVSEVGRCMWDMGQSYKIAHGETDNTISLLTYDPVDLTIWAYLEQNQEWDDYFDRVTQDLSIKIWKPDRTNYQFITFNNAHPKAWKETGQQFQGIVEHIGQYQAEKLTFAFTHEGSNFDTYYKHIA
jgi:hypothetical protein